MQGRFTHQDVLQLSTIKKQWDLDATYTITTKEVIIRPPVFHSPLETIVLICVLMEVKKFVYTKHAIYMPPS